MNHFNLFSGLILFGLTALCFWLPYKSGKKITAILVGSVLGGIILWSLLAEIEFLVIFIWPTLLIFQIVFLSYWVFKVFNKKKIGIIISSILSIGFLLLILSPWITDWTFSKSDAKELLSEQHIILNDEFSLVNNESGGFRDYYHIFILELSNRDKSRLIEQVKSEANYLDGINNRFYLPELAKDRYKGDTLYANYETEWHYKKAIFYPNGTGYAPTYRIISISKEGNELKFEEIID